MFRSNLILALRNLFRNKAFALINIAGLCAGITCSLVIILFVRYEMTFDHHALSADRTYRVVQETKFPEGTAYWSTTAYPLAAAIRSDLPSVDIVTQVAGPVSRLFRVEDASGNATLFEEPLVLFADPEYPKVFGLQWTEGDPATALANPASVILTEQLAAKYFRNESGRRSLLGRHLMLNNKDQLTVTGIVKDPPGNTSVKFKMIVPYEFFRVNNQWSTSNWRGNYQGTTYVVLKEGRSSVAFEERIHVWKKKYLQPEDDSRIDYKLQPLMGMHNDAKYGNSPHSYAMPLTMLYAALSVGMFILIIACANFVNLATAQAAGRAKEVGIRKVLGSSKLGLAMQFLNENVVLVLFTVLLSLALIRISLDKVNEMMSLIDLRLSFDMSVVAIAFALGAFVVALACFYPSFMMASFHPLQAIKGKTGINHTKGLSIRKTLIVFQFAIVQIFIIATMVIALQMDYFRSKDLGFSKEDPIITTNIDQQDRRETLRQKLLLNPAIKEVSFSSSSPTSDYGHHYGTSFRLPGQPEEAGQKAEEKGIDENFIPFYRLELLAGRNFSATQETFNEFVVNEKMVKGIGMTPEQAIGQRLIINEGEAVIVGVVRDFHNKGLQEEITPCVFLNSSQWLDRSNIKIDPSKNLAETMAFVEKSWKEIYPDGYYQGSFLDDALAKNYVIEEFIFEGFTLFSVLTICIGCLGLYGLLSFFTARKRKEVGIRKVLGASVPQIVGIFSTEFTGPIAIAFMIAAPLSWYFMDQWLLTFVYRIELSWWMLAAGAVITAGIVLVTISYQSIRAALANPVEALRQE